MYAVLVKVELSENPNPEILREQVIPKVKQLDGFIAGYWTRSDRVGRSMVVFDSQDNAKAASELVPSMVPPGTNIDSIEVAEVVASA